MFAADRDFVPSLCWRLFPALDGFHDLAGNVQSGVDVPGNRLRGGAFANLQDLSIARGQQDGDYLVRAKLLAQRPPRGKHAAIQEWLPDRHQQMVSQHAQENMRPSAMLQLVEDGPLRERTLHGPERRFDPLPVGAFWWSRGCTWATIYAIPISCVKISI